MTETYNERLYRLALRDLEEAIPITIEQGFDPLPVTEHQKKHAIRASYLNGLGGTIIPDGYKVGNRLRAGHENVELTLTDDIALLRSIAFAAGTAMREWLDGQ